MPESSLLFWSLCGALVFLLGLLLFAALRLLAARRERERLLRESDLLFADAPYGALSLSGADLPDATVRRANRAAGELLGRPPEELSERALREVLGGEELVPPPGGSLDLELPREDGASRSLRAHLVSGEGESVLILTDRNEEQDVSSAFEDLKSRYREASRRVPFLTYTLDPATGEFSREGGEWLGGLPGTPELPVYPEDAAALESFRRALRSPDGALEEAPAEPGASPAQESPAELPEGIEYRLRLPDGEVLRLREEVWREPDGPRGGLVRGLILDVTALREAGEGLERSEGLRRATLAAAREVLGGGFAVRSEGRLFEVDEGFAAVLGESPERLAGRPVLDLVHPESERAARAGMRRTDRGEPEPPSRMRWVRPGGGSVRVEVAAAPASYRGEAAAVVYLRDVSAEERERAEERTLLDALRSENAALLRSMRSASADLEAELREVPEVPPETSRRLSEKLASLAAVSREEVARERVDLSELARDAGTRLKERAPRRDVDVIVAGGLVVEGDREVLREAVRTLFESSFSAASKSPRPRLVFGRVEPEAAREAVFFLRDNGPGFDMAGAGELLDPLAAGGPGGGRLYVAEQAIERHGGRLWVGSEVGRGTTFYFTLR